VWRADGSGDKLRLSSVELPWERRKALRSFGNRLVVAARLVRFPTLGPPRVRTVTEAFVVGMALIGPAS